MSRRTGRLIARAGTEDESAYEGSFMRLAAIVGRTKPVRQGGRRDARRAGPGERNFDRWWAGPNRLGSRWGSDAADAPMEHEIGELRRGPLSTDEGP